MGKDLSIMKNVFVMFFSFPGATGSCFGTICCSTLYVQAMNVVRMGDASAEAFEHMLAGLKALLVSGAPFAEKRDGLGTCPDRGGCSEETAEAGEMQELWNGRAPPGHVHLAAW